TSSNLTQNHKIPANQHLRKPRKASHNPKVAGSNPAPAIRKSPAQAGFLWGKTEPGAKRARMCPEISEAAAASARDCRVRGGELGARRELLPLILRGARGSGG